MKSIKIAKFEKNDIPAAASLFCKQYENERLLSPDLPNTYKDTDAVIPLITKLSGKTQGIAMTEDNELIGYFIGITIPEFKSPHKGIYCPEWAHGAAQAGRSEIYRRMYESISNQWILDKCYIHCVTIMAADVEVATAFSLMGFGTNTIDAIMSIGQIGDWALPGIKIKSIGKENIDDIMPLVRGLVNHVSASPCFLHIDTSRDTGFFERFLSEKDKSIWVAYSGNDAVSYMQCEPSSEARACYIVRHPETIAISGAYTTPEFRNKGIATAVLSRLLEDSVQKRYKKCSVDFESANQLAASFWLKQFKPICYSMLRYVDERISLMD